MRSRKPAQAGFPPASRDFSRQAASGTTLSHQVRRSATRNRHATRCAQRLSEPLEPFRLRRDRRARRRVIWIGSKTWKSDGLVYGRTRGQRNVYNVHQSPHLRACYRDSSGRNTLDRTSTGVPQVTMSVGRASLTKSPASEECKYLLVCIGSAAV